MTTPPRQVWFFQFGCWSAIAAAMLHLAAYFAVPADLSTLDAAAVAAPHVFVVPGMFQPSLLSVTSGLSLSLALLLASIGGAGLAVVRHGGDHAKLLRGVSGAFALGTGALLVVSVAQFFGVLTFVIAVVALCFGLASVPEE